MTKVQATVLAGFVAITVNTLVLKSAAPLGIVAESGGLLRLHVLYVGPLLRRLGVTGLWTSAGLPGPSSLAFWLAFHYATGFAMVLVYTLFLERVLPGSGFVKGSVFSLVPWLINGLAVLPLLDQGAFGVRRLPISGIVYFFIANWMFGAVLGVVYARSRNR